MKAKKCPVCDWDIGKDAREVRIGQRVVSVCCQDCAEKVRKEPARYAGQKR